jgi:integrase
MVRSRPFGTVTKLPSGRYRARYWELGRQVTAPWTFATKTDARTWLASIETEIARGEHPDPTAASISFTAYASDWMENRALRPHTRATYRSQLQHIAQRFGNVDLVDITPVAVRAWHGALVRSGLDANTAAKVYRLFRTIMGTAVEDGMLRSNPVGIRGAAVERLIERPLVTWVEVGDLARAIHPRFGALVWTAAASGLRFGELAGLQRRHVDLDRSQLRVEQSLSFVAGRGATLGPPKSSAAYRSVVLPATGRELLAAHVAAYAGQDDADLVFTTINGRPLLNRYFAPYWRRAKLSAGIDEGVRFHDLRHLAGTTAASAGASLREIMTRMGHASSDAALRYLKASERRDAEIASAIELRLAKELGPPDPRAS